jgi:hypothetical protein
MEVLIGTTQVDFSQIIFHGFRRDQESLAIPINGRKLSFFNEPSDMSVAAPQLFRYFWNKQKLTQFRRWFSIKSFL